MESHTLAELRALALQEARDWDAGEDVGWFWRNLLHITLAQNETWLVKPEPWSPPPDPHGIITGARRLARGARWALCWLAIALAAGGAVWLLEQARR